MPDRVTIAETRLHTLKGEFPEVSIYSHIDQAELYKGDPDPFHIVLPIAEIGRISKNGLEYDTGLVSAIAEQLQTGIGGIRGHIPDENIGTAYPIDAVLWVGHVQQGDVLFAKGYVPPGENRDDIRRRKAIGGTVGTSIFGNAIKEQSQGKKKLTWKAKEFKLEQVDLAPSQRAALENKRGFLITKEMQEGEAMTFENLTAADVPAAIREQIISETEAGKKLAQLAEMETQNAALNTEVAELRQYASIVAEIRTTLGKDTDVQARVTEYHTAMTKLAEILGVSEYANISVRVEEMFQNVKEFQQQKFETSVDTKVAELTNWNPQDDKNKEKVAKFRANFRRNVVAGLGDERAPEKVTEIAQHLWDDEYSVMGAALVAEMGGPAALVGGAANPKPSVGTKAAEDREKEARAAFELK